MYKALYKPVSIIFILLLFVGFNQITHAQETFTKPKVEQLVIDKAGVFSQAEQKALTQKLNSFSYETSTQILVYTTPELDGYDIADFSQRIGEEYGVGSAKNDNGIVIVFKPKTAASSGQIWMSVGYGIEPLIPDATANQITNNEMIPYFKQGQIYDGINAGIDVCISLTKGEFTAQHYKEQNSRGASAGGGIFLIIMLIAFFSIFGRSRSSRYSNMGTRSNLPLWAALFMMGNSSHRGSGWSDFSSGSGSFGGGSSFGGFGGGSFGGGGAGGSW